MKLLTLVVNFDTNEDNEVHGVWCHWKKLDYLAYGYIDNYLWQSYSKEIDPYLGYDPMYLPVFFTGSYENEHLLLLEEYIDKNPNQWNEFLSEQISQGKYNAINSNDS